MENEIELLSPAGDFDCLKAAVQNGADCVYFGSDLFNARASARNFAGENLQKAIKYCKLRGVKTNLTLNILIKDEEFNQALEVARRAYEYGIDAIIVQDLGLAKELIRIFPDLPIHASTQMSVHNLEGALELQELGFSRVVLSRELSIEEIEYICQNTSVEIECFIHGALCISYSGQCLFSSMIGGRSGNRGTCAQSCRLPYELVENNKTIDKGFLLSPKDLCSLDYIPQLVKAGVTSLKIEGRMKTPEYVAQVTKTYRKYVDMAISGKNYEVEPTDITDLKQVFNRGNLSSGHLDSRPNQSLICPEKPNNMGLFIGHISKTNNEKGLIKLNSSEPLQIGDTISIEGETNTYTISELMKSNQNIKSSLPGEYVTLGRMKGKIKIGAKVYKMSSKLLNQINRASYQGENRQIPLNCTVTIKKHTPISIHITSANDINIYQNLKIDYSIDTSIPEDAKSKPLTEDRILEQICKTSNTPYYFKKVKVKLDKNTFLPNIKNLNELRRNALDQVEKYAYSKISRKSHEINTENYAISNKQSTPSVSVLLNKIDLKSDYTFLTGLDNVYIPLKYFANKKYEKTISAINSKYCTYIYMPTIIKSNYRNLLKTVIEETTKKFEIKGFILSNISNFEILKNYTNYEFIANYTFNIFNYNTICKLSKLGIEKFTVSPEIDKQSIQSFIEKSNQELICYGRTPLMNMSYCPLGKSNKCYPKCSMLCKTENTYYLKDRLNLKFPVIPDNTQTVTTIYNSKITSISPKEYTGNYSKRIDILEETPEQIQIILNKINSGTRLAGSDYTNGKS